MAQFLTLLSILLLVAVFKPDKLESSALSVPDEDEDGVDNFPIEVKESDDGIIECLEKDERSLYCTKLRNYPDKKNIEQLINEKFPHFKKILNNDLVSTQNISHRIEGPVKEYLCNTRTRIIFPEAVRDYDDVWIPLIQTDEYKQGLAIEECVETGEICGEKNGIIFPRMYEAICKQHYVKRALLTVRSATIMKGEFKFPSCCKCELYE